MSDKGDVTVTITVEDNRAAWTWDKDYAPEQMPKPMTPEAIAETLGNGNREVPHVEKKEDVGFTIWTADGQVLARVPCFDGQEEAIREFMADVAHAIANAGPAIDGLRNDVAVLQAGKELIEKDRDKIASALRKEVRKALTDGRELLEEIMRSRKASVGSMGNVYEAQFDVKQIGRLHEKTVAALENK